MNNLLEAKAVRIAHPEDMVFDSGSSGINQAINALQVASLEPNSITLKWDGSPSIIFGRDIDGKAILTDKAGFAQEEKGKIGFARTRRQAQEMIYNRAPEQEGRLQYSLYFSQLMNSISKILPKEFIGFIQADVLWFERPELVDGNYKFKPNKITYSVAASSELGQEISQSHIGIAVHSYFKSIQDTNTVQATKQSLGLIPNKHIVVFDATIDSKEVMPEELPELHTVSELTEQHGSDIDIFLNKVDLATQKIADLPTLMKMFASKTASQGKRLDKNAAQDFITWLNNNQTINASKVERILTHIRKHEYAYKLIWRIVNLLTVAKYKVKNHYDTQTGAKIAADKDGKSGHEGFVANTPHGTIKLVDRPSFMGKDQVSESEIVLKKRLNEIESINHIGKNDLFKQSLSLWPKIPDTQPIGKIKGFHIFMEDSSNRLANNNYSFVLYNANEKEYVAVATFVSKNIKNYLEIHTISIAKTYQGQNLSILLYKWLINNKTTSLISGNRQSEGGKSIWMKMAADPQIKVFVWNKQTKKAHAFDKDDFDGSIDLYTADNENEIIDLEANKNSTEILYNKAYKQDPNSEQTLYLSNELDKFVNQINQLEKFKDLKALVLVAQKA